jgi:alkylated DNA repair dioxygenase AlkB
MTYQASLFEAEPPRTRLPVGLVYEPFFLEAGEASRLIQLIDRLPLAQAVYKGHLARRLVMSFGGTFDFDTNTLAQAEPLIEELLPLRDKVAQWAAVKPEDLVHALVARYPAGAALGWHRDVPDFEEVFGVSLGAPAVLRFRPYPPLRPKPRDIKRLVAEPGSVYAMRGPARWSWQHSVAPVEATRYSVTFRTARSIGGGISASEFLSFS